jgi:hypothetical protein
MAQTDPRIRLSKSIFITHPLAAILAVGDCAIVSTHVWSCAKRSTGRRSWVTGPFLLVIASAGYLQPSGVGCLPGGHSGLGGGLAGGGAGFVTAGVAGCGGGGGGGAGRTAGVGGGV